MLDMTSHSYLAQTPTWAVLRNPLALPVPESNMRPRTWRSMQHDCMLKIWLQSKPSSISTSKTYSPGLTSTLWCYGR